jgi:hypothetical protein
VAVIFWDDATSAAASAGKELHAICNGRERDCGDQGVVAWRQLMVWRRVPIPSEVPCARCTACSISRWVGKVSTSISSAFAPLVTARTPCRHSARRASPTKTCSTIRSLNVE